MPSASKPAVLVVIPCAAVDGLARRCVESCLALAYGNFQVVLLPDERPTEALPADPRLHVLPTGTVSIARKRNLGMAAFPEQDFFAFIDSDAYPEPDWLANAVGAFGNLPDDVWLIGGPNVSPPDQAFTARIVGAAARSALLSGAGAFRKRRSASRYCRDLPACNLVARAAAVRAVGGFDEALVTGEDIDLCARARARGGRTYFAGNVCVFHRDRQLLLPFLRQRFVYGCSVWELFRRDPGPHKAYLFLPFLFLAGLVAGPLLFAYPPAPWIYGGALLLFAALAGAEAARLTPLPAVPVTVLVFFLGAVVPGVGSAVALARLPMDVASVYRGSRNRG